VKGILIASLTSVCVAFVVTLREYARDLTRHVDRGLVRDMVAFGWPTIAGGLAFYGLNLLDRFFVRHYHGFEDNGLYGIAFRFSQVVVVGVLAFRLGWPQWHYAWLSSDRHPAMVARGANYYFFGVGMLAVLVAAWILPVLELVVRDDYVAGYRAVAPLGLAAVATGAYAVFAAGLNVTKRMRLIPPTALAASGVAVGLYFLLIPPYSFVGAAWATAAALGLLAVMVLAVSQRVYPVPWDWRRIGLAVSLIVSLSLASLAVDAWIPMALSIPIRAGITLAYPIVLYAFRFFPPDDLAAVRARLRLRRGRRR
jgi:O-antigen/teichoic acid export membrane protein